MKRLLALLTWLLALTNQSRGQIAPSPHTLPVQQQLKDEMTQAVTIFLATLTPEQKQKAMFPLSDPERFNWHYVPRERKGLPLKQMTAEQRKAAMELLKTGVSVQGYDKAMSIMDNENVLRILDNRPPNDTYRDPENYSFTIFGEPSTTDPWSWRIEGHHLSLQFLSLSGKVMAQTPTFFGSNPGVIRFDSTMADKRMADPRILKMPQKGRQILKQETERAFSLLKTLSDTQRKQAILGGIAYPEIVTSNKRKASLERMDGLRMGDMNAEQQTLFMNLLQVYLSNYRITLANQQLANLRKTGLADLRFGWAGDLTPELGEGKGWYYRIHGPTLLIEYDNSQTNANHIHTVVRDLTNDFGEDLLQQHYQTTAHPKP